MWFKVLEGSLELDTMTKVSVEGKSLVISNFNGVIRCFDDRCPHEDFQLSLGCVQEGRVKCSLHGFSFDLSTGESSEDGIGSLRLYPIKIKQNTIFVEINPDQ
jgi:3-phenylpropionate/trans-cinnamate dioxygenase ferredoxin subunit